MTKYPMTIYGAQALQQELDHLKSVERKNIIHAIAEARGHGDISENAEYDAAKDRQALIEARISTLEHKISLAHIIDPQTINESKIVFGATVTLLDLDANTQLCYQIVGDEEADLKHSKISINSPVGRALIGKQTGDACSVVVPNGVKEYEIIKIVYR